jgi:hypothetical protein
MGKKKQIKRLHIDLCVLQSEVDELKWKIKQLEKKLNTQPMEYLHPLADYTGDISESYPSDLSSVHISVNSIDIGNYNEEV